MDAAWIGLIGVLVGGLIASVGEFVRGRLMFRQEKRSEGLQERRRRLEELYEVIENHKELYTDFFGKALLRISGTEPPKDSVKEKIPWGRLQMLVSLYAPELRPEMDRVHQAASKVGEVAARVITERSPDKANRQELGNRLVVDHKALSRAYEDLQSGVVRISNEMATALYSDWTVPRQGGTAGAEVRNGS